MPNYVYQFDNVKIPNLPGRFGTIPADPLAESLIANLADENGLPVVQHWFDPAPAFFATESGFLVWRDRMSGEKFRVVGGSPTLGPGINGQPALILDGGGRLANDSGTAEYNPGAWSTVAVLRTDLATGLKSIIGRAGSTTAPVPVHPTLLIQPSSSPPRNIFASRINGTGAAIRAAHNSASVDYVGANLAVVNTFSQQAGIGLRRNGIEVARNANATEPLTETKFAIGGDQSGSIFSGQLHHLFICRVDLSLPQWAFALQRIESFLLSKYAITPGS